MSGEWCKPLTAHHSLFQHSPFPATGYNPPPRADGARQQCDQVGDASRRQQEFRLDQRNEHEEQSCEDQAEQQRAHRLRQRAHARKGYPASARAPARRQDHQAGHRADGQCCGGARYRENSAREQKWSHHRSAETMSGASPLALHRMQGADKRPNPRNILRFLKRRCQNSYTHRRT